MLREHAGAVESDLSRYHQIDYRDRWRFDADGHRKLTLRMIAVRLAHLPFDSATKLALDGTGWGLGDYLTAHLYAATVGEPHPWLPEEAKAEDPQRAKAIRLGKQRVTERQRAIDAGEIT